jgi:hypothetical protein
VCTTGEFVALRYFKKGEEKGREFSGVQENGEERTEGEAGVLRV